MQPTPVAVDPITASGDQNDTNMKMYALMLMIMCYDYDICFPFLQNAGHSYIEYIVMNTV